MITSRNKPLGRLSRGKTGRDVHASSGFFADEIVCVELAVDLNRQSGTILFQFIGPMSLPAGQ
jgi:hypothetical protein